MTSAALTAYPPQGSARDADASSPPSPLAAIAAMTLMLLLVAPYAGACTRASIIAVGDCVTPEPTATPRAPPPPPPTALELTNRARTEHGRVRLRIDSRAQRVARAYAASIAARKTLAHNPRLHRLFPGRAVGEIVGVGPSVARVHRGFMSSAPHRRVMLSRALSGIGVGVVARSGSVWVVQVFVSAKTAGRVREAARAERARAHVAERTHTEPRRRAPRREAAPRERAAVPASDGARVPRAIPSAMVVAWLLARALTYRRLAR